MATIGRSKAVAELAGGIRLKGFPAWMAWLFIHLVLLVGFRNRVVVFFNWMWNYFSYDRAIRLIIRPFKGR
jgi:NADH dehydrogenase